MIISYSIIGLDQWGSSRYTVLWYTVSPNLLELTNNICMRLDSYSTIPNWKAMRFPTRCRNWLITPLLDLSLLRDLTTLPEMSTTQLRYLSVVVGFQMKETGPGTKWRIWWRMFHICSQSKLPPSKIDWSKHSQNKNSACCTYSEPLSSTAHYREGGAVDPDTDLVYRKLDRHITSLPNENKFRYCLQKTVRLTTLATRNKFLYGRQCWQLQGWL